MIKLLAIAVTSLMIFLTSLWSPALVSGAAQMNPPDQRRFFGGWIYGWKQSQLPELWCGVL